MRGTAVNSAGTLITFQVTVTDAGTYSLCYDFAGGSSDYSNKVGDITITGEWIARMIMLDLQRTVAPHGVAWAVCSPSTGMTCAVLQLGHHTALTVHQGGGPADTTR